MDIDVISHKENPLMQRKEYWLSVDHDGKETPSRYVLLPEIARKLGCEEGSVVLHKVFSERGLARSRAKVYVYGEKKHIKKEMLERQERKVKKHLEKHKKAGGEESASGGHAGKAEKDD
jgi:ribosomal protein S24E